MIMAIIIINIETFCPLLHDLPSECSCHWKCSPCKVRWPPLMIKIMIIMMVMILIFAFNDGDDVTYEVANPCVPRARVAHQSPSCQCVNLQIMVHCHPFHHHHDLCQPQHHAFHPHLGEPCDQVLTVWIFPPEFVFRPSLRPGNSHLDFKKNAQKVKFSTLGSVSPSFAASQLLKGPSLPPSPSSWKSLHFLVGSLY